MRAKWVATIVAAEWILAATGLAHAREITMRMGGVITYSSNPSLTGMSAGDPWCMTYTFDSEAPDQAPDDPNSGQYFENSVSLTVAGQAVAVYYVNQITVGNDYTPWYDPAASPYDYYSVGVSLAPFKGQGWPALGAGVADWDASVFSGDSLPLRAWPLDEFESSGFSIYDALDGAFNVEGSVTYWVLVGSADSDGDGDVDLGDFGVFHVCFNGPNRPPALSISQCYGVDLDNDLDVDLSDFSAFQACFNGPNRPPAC